MASKIEKELTPAEVEKLCDTLFNTPGGAKHLPTIQKIAKEYGVSVSKMGASTFRDGTLADYIAQLKAKGERSQQIAEFAREGLSLSEAAAIRLSETVFDKLMSTNADALAPEEQDIYSKIIARARLGDDRAKKLEADLKLRDEQISKLESERAEREARDAQLQIQAEKAKAELSKPAASEEELRQKAINFIDQTFGFKSRKK
ncbi:MAG: hypothetical protein LBV12_07105 [Puniceicoccales bacterium]|jgi:hypothetical protein|nr:hypothetical protein [Puniceicoccales bacterium]